MIREAIKNSFYTQKEMSEMSGVPKSTISAWGRGLTSPSAQAAVNLLSSLGLIEYCDAIDAMKKAKGTYTTMQIEEASGIPLSSLENYLYHGTMPSYQTYLDYMETINLLNSKVKE